MAFLNKVGSCNMTGSIDVVANSISLIQPNGSLVEFSGDGIANVVNQTVSATSIGLGNVNNTSDVNKPISTATQNALNNVVANTNTTLTTHLGLINGHTLNINNINSTLTSQLQSINGHTLNINNINSTLTSQLQSINGHTLNINNINSTLTSQLQSINGLITSTNNTFVSHLNLINTNSANTTALITSTNNTFASHFSLIKSNITAISDLTTDIDDIWTVLTNQASINTNDKNRIDSLNTSVSNINEQLPALASVSFVNQKVSNLVGSAPELLDTLGELSNAIANNPNMSTTVMNSIANVGMTASSALATTKSILTNILPTLAMSSNTQPLDITGTLANLPVNITTMNPYFDGFPTDQIAWAAYNGAQFISNINTYPNYLYQTLTFPSFTASLHSPPFIIKYANQTCTLSLSIWLDTATQVSISVIQYYNNTTTILASTQFFHANTWSNRSMTFTSPADTSQGNLLVVVNSAAGIVKTRGWAVFAGTEISTKIRGNLDVPFGTVNAFDVLYGNDKTSLQTTLSTLATDSSLSIQLNTKLNSSDPVFSGALTNTTNTFRVGLNGSVYCNDVFYGYPSNQLSLVAALATKLDVSFPTFSGVLRNIGNNFNVDTSGNVAAATFGTTGNITCGDLKYGANALSLTNSLSNINTSINNITTSLLDYQPLDETETLANIPKNITTTSTYFDLFPNDSPVWTTNNDASFVNNVNIGTGMIYQVMTFPGATASLTTLNIMNKYPNQLCTVSFSMLLFTATSFTLTVQQVNSNNTTTVLTTQTFTNASTWTNKSVSFSSPATGQTVFNLVVGNTTGIVYTRGWAVFSGSINSTQFRGSIDAPLGTVNTSDVLYGANGTSLQASLATLTATDTSLSTQIATKLNTAGPTFTGNLSGNSGTLLVDTTGNITCAKITEKTYSIITLYGNVYGHTWNGTIASANLTTYSTLQSYIYLHWSLSATTNFPATFTNTYRLTIPYTGIYSIQFTTCVGNGSPNPTYFQFISKNLGANNEYADTWTDQLMCNSYVSSPGASYGNSVSAVGYFTAGDYISFGIYLLTGTWTPYSNRRSTATVALIQRTA